MCLPGNFAMVISSDFRATQYRVDDHQEDAPHFTILNDPVLKQDFSTFTSTLSTEFYLICDQARLSDTATSISFIGFFLGAFFGGMLADKFGRKKTMIVSLALTAISLYAQAFIPGYAAFLVFRVAVMAFNHMAYLSYCCYVCEIVGQGEFVLRSSLGGGLHL